MARADRLERMENLRLDLEAEYRAALIAALEASPRGLLDPAQDKITLAKVTPVLEALAEQADAVDELRDKLGLDEFALHRDFLARRKPAKAHEVGEAKQIRAWLEQLKTEDSSSRT